MLPPVSYIVKRERTSPLFGCAFAQGCHGPVSKGDTLLPGDVALFGSPARWELLQQARQEGRTWYYGDHGYFGRGEYFRITRNAYQHSGVGTPDYRRFARFKRPVQPWRSHGEHVLVCPQTARYFQLHGLDSQQWIHGVTDTIRKYSQRRIIVRTKADARKRPIEQDLKGAWAVVVYSSAAALDALIAGIPVFVLADFAAAYRMGIPDLRQINRPLRPPGREEFLAVLAANQWTYAEIERGVAWRALQEPV